MTKVKTRRQLDEVTKLKKVEKRRKSDRIKSREEVKKPISTPQNIVVSKTFKKQELKNSKKLKHHQDASERKQHVVEHMHGRLADPKRLDASKNYDYTTSILDSQVYNHGVDKQKKKKERKREKKVDSSEEEAETPPRPRRKKGEKIRKEKTVEEGEASEDSVHSPIRRTLIARRRKGGKIREEKNEDEEKNEEEEPWWLIAPSRKPIPKRTRPRRLIRNESPKTVAEDASRKYKKSRLQNDGSKTVVEDASKKTKSPRFQNESPKPAVEDVGEKNKKPKKKSKNSTPDIATIRKVNDRINIIEEWRDGSENVLGSKAHLDENTFKTNVGAPSLKKMFNQPDFDEEENDEAPDKSEFFEVRQKCDLCGAEFINAEALQHHIRTFVEKKNSHFIFDWNFNPALQMTIICPVIGCCFRTINLKQHYAHMKSTHPGPEHNEGFAPGQIPIYQDHDDEKNKERLKCPQCYKLFTRPDRHRKHVNECQGRVSFPCDMCGEFTSKLYSEVIKHARAAHSIEVTGFSPMNEFKEMAKLNEVTEENLAELTKASANYKSEVSRQRNGRDVFITYTKPFARGMIFFNTTIFQPCYFSTLLFFQPYYFQVSHQ